jgi:hypothetical protein
MSKIKKLIPVELLRENLEYREEIENGILKGNLYRKNGKKAGWLDNRGYERLNFNYNNKKQYISNHVAIYCIIEGKYPDKCLDHKDGNKINNLISNLRNATEYQNRLNVGPFKNKSSQYKGVSYVKSTGLWSVVTKNTLNKKKYSCKFTDEIDAALAYNEAAKKIHDSEFIYLNDISNGYTNKEYPNKPRGWKPE